MEAKIRPGRSQAVPKPREVPPSRSRKVAVVGLGYVGLPLAVAFGRSGPTVGFDVSAARVEELRTGRDGNGEVSADELARGGLEATCESARLAECDIFVVTVPTPVDKAKRPDLSHLRSASRTVGEALKARGARQPVPIVVYESTVYPGCTEEVCGPEVEAASGLVWGEGFHLAYSPERINPGDREHTLENVVKIVAADTPGTLEVVATLYEGIVAAGVHRAPDIRTAEAAKVIENTQRDLNIALMNELAVLFHRLGIDTRAVLEAAGTKWNFLPFTPGLVGGHCIPEDPYYLTHKAEEVGIHPQVVLAGRRINDSMGRYVAQETVKLLTQRGVAVRGCRVLVLGVTFKEDVPDVRNTRVVELVRELEEYGCQVAARDPVAGQAAVEALGLAWDAGDGMVDCVVLAVPHKDLVADPSWRSRLGPGGVLVDVKGAAGDVAEGWTYWRL